VSLGLKRKIQADVKLQINIKHTDLIKDMSLGIQAYQLGMQVGWHTCSVRKLITPVGAAGCWHIASVLTCLIN
jgi:hypothetical protein